MLPIWIICSESHYSILFGTDISVVKNPPLSFDLIYYDELARQEEDILLTVTTNKPAAKSKYTIPIDCTMRTKWNNAHIDWNGRTQIL